MWRSPCQSDRVYWIVWFFPTLIYCTHWSCQSMLPWMGSVQYCHRCQLVKVRQDPLLLQVRPWAIHKRGIRSTGLSFWLEFSHWLKGNSFTVWTDNNPLPYIMSKPKLDTCEQHWAANLAPYTFNLKYISLSHGHSGWRTQPGPVR